MLRSESVAHHCLSYFLLSSLWCHLLISFCTHHHWLLTRLPNGLHLHLRLHLLWDAALELFHLFWDDLVGH